MRKILINATTDLGIMLKKTPQVVMYLWRYRNPRVLVCGRDLVVVMCVERLCQRVTFSLAAFDSL